MIGFRNVKKRGFMASAALMALTLPALGQAQTAAAPPEAADSHDIVVTATRKEQLLSKVPISISAFSQARADQLGIKSFLDTVKFTPGVSISQSNSGGDNIAIRGISSNAGASTTGIYIDDTPIQIRQLGLNSNGAEPIVFDLDRIEVLRGPQGTLFGSGSEGGTVRYITPQPSLTKASVYARSELSSTQKGGLSYEGGIAEGGPIIDGVLGYRLSAFYRRDGGYIDRIDPYTNAVTPNANSVNNYSLRGALAWSPTSGLIITPTVQYQKRQVNSTSVAGYYVGLSNPEQNQYAEATPTPMTDNDRFYLGALKVEYSNDWVKVISNTSYFDRKEIVNGYDGTTYNLSYFQHSLAPNPYPTGQANPASGLDPNFATCVACRMDLYPLLTPTGINPQFIKEFGAYRSPNVITNTQQNFTQEIRFQSNSRTSKWNWTAGIFYSKIKQQSDEQIIDPALNAISQYLFGEDILTAWVVPLLPNGASYQNKGNSNEWQVAAFADVTYAATEKLKINLGLRWAKTHFDFTNVTQGPEAFGAKASSGEQNETPITPKFNISYQATPGDLFYATVSKGFRVGGANAPLLPVCTAANAAPSQFNSDSIWNYEAGTKLKLLGGKLRVAASAYLINWSNIQQSVYDTSCGQQFVGNLGSLTSKGFDFQAEIHPARNLSIDLAVGYTHARYTQNSVVSTFTVGFTGDTVAGSPWTISGGVQYDFSVGGHKAFLRMDDEYASRNSAYLISTDPKLDANGNNTLSYDPNLNNDPATNQASIRAGMNFGRMDAALFANNLFNAHPQLNYAHQDQNTATYTASTLRPRTFGLFISYKY